MAEEYGADWSRIHGGEPATGDDYSIIEGSPPNIADLYDWSTVDAGFPGVPDLTGIAEGRPPAEDQSAPGVFYWSLDPDAPENTRNVTPFTKLTYSFLPEFFKTADQRANHQEGGWPMLRFLDAPGHLADNIRATVDDMHRGKWTDPTTVPDRAVPWLASVLGVPQSQKNVPNTQLRQVLTDMVENGRAPTGTRSELANAAKQFLTGSREILVAPQASQPRGLNQADLDLAQAVGYGGRVVNVHSTPIEPPGGTDDLWVEEDTGNVYTWDGATWNLYGGDVTALAQAVITTRAEERLTRAHTIIVLARPDDVPNGDLAALAANLRNVGVVPAGHALQIVTAAATWSNWEAEVQALGGTWQAWEDATTTWASDEAIGIGDFGGA